MWTFFHPMALLLMALESGRISSHLFRKVNTVFLELLICKTIYSYPRLCACHYLNQDRTALPRHLLTSNVESLVTVGASSRSYRFLVDTDRNRKAKELLYNRMANPDILAAKAEELNNENTVFVGNIPFEAAEADVKEFFSICGAIVSVIMPKGNTDHRVLDAYPSGLLSPSS